MDWIKMRGKKTNKNRIVRGSLFAFIEVAGNRLANNALCTFPNDIFGLRLRFFSFIAAAVARYLGRKNNKKAVTRFGDLAEA
jgi:hypothetical protein